MDARPEFPRRFGSPSFWVTRTRRLSHVQSATAIAEAVTRFDAACVNIDLADCTSNAERLSAERFRAEAGEFLEQASREFASIAGKS